MSKDRSTHPSQGHQPSRRKSNRVQLAEKLEEERELEKAAQQANSLPGKDQNSAQDMLLGKTGAPVVQRQRLAAQIGRVAGNRRLESMIAQRQETMDEEEDTGPGAAEEDEQTVMLKPANNQPSIAQKRSAKEKQDRATSGRSSNNPQVVQRVVPVALGAAEWIALGAAGYIVGQDAVQSTAGDVSYSFDEMEGVLLPGGGNDVTAYRTSHPAAAIQSYRHTVSVWNGTGPRKLGIKFGISFNYDGYAIGNISCDIIDTYDWPMWSGSVNVNFTPLSLAAGGVSKIRITLNVNADRTFAGGMVRSRILELDGAGTIKTTGSGAPVRFGE